MIDRANLRCEVEVDGGIDEETAPLASSRRRGRVRGGVIGFGRHRWAITAAMSRLSAADSWR